MHSGCNYSSSNSQHTRIVRLRSALGLIGSGLRDYQRTLHGTDCTAERQRQRWFTMRLLLRMLLLVAAVVAVITILQKWNGLSARWRRQSRSTGSYIKDSVLSWFCTSKQPLHARGALHASPEICLGVCNRWTGQLDWTIAGLDYCMDSNFNALKILLCSPVIFIYTCRVAQYALTTCKIAMHFVAKWLSCSTHTFTYLCTISDV